MTLHSGGCQCGAVRYSVDIDLSDPVICNCSRCQRSGAVLAFVPRTAFTLVQGEDAQTEYLFNTHKIHHLFCKTCGIQSYSTGATPDGTEIIGININCLDGVNPREYAAKAQFHDGAAA